jgi:hypothetical protein
MRQATAHIHEQTDRGELTRDPLEFPVMDVRIQAIHINVFDKETFSAEFM